MSIGFLRVNLFGRFFEFFFDGWGGGIVALFAPFVRNLWNFHSIFFPGSVSLRRGQEGRPPTYFGSRGHRAGWRIGGSCEGRR